MTQPLTARVLDTLLATDSYKLDHRRQYPPGTEFVYSNLTARGTRIPAVDATVFFGLQALLADLHARWQEFFGLEPSDVDTVLADYEAEVCRLLGVLSFDTSHLRDLHELGYLPVRIRAVREGTLVPLRVPYLTVENTDPRFFWLTNYLETELSAGLWQPITSATIAWRARRLLDARARQSGAPAPAVCTQGHDFSCRGMAGLPAAAASSAGHLLSFTGSDTLGAVRFVERFYGVDDPNTPIATSIPASEHSVMMADGPDGEYATFRRLLDTYPTGSVSIVSDTWNLWRVLHTYLPELREKIMARTGGAVVIRPDTGDPLKILCGDADAAHGSPERLGVVRSLWETFGGTVNDKGFRELDPHIGVVYGDSITFERAEAITAALLRMGFVSTTVTLGFGSFTYQYQTRDTFNMAMKATWVRVDGQGRDLVKDPITGDGMKKSATGRLAVRRMMSGQPYLVQQAQPWQEADETLEEVYRDGAVLRRWTFDRVRAELAHSTGTYEAWGGSTDFGVGTEIAERSAP